MVLINLPSSTSTRVRTLVLHVEHEHKPRIAVLRPLRFFFNFFLNTYNNYRIISVKIFGTIIFKNLSDLSLFAK
jgi:hypothetical protein